MARLLIIGFIWLGCAAAWAILASSLTIRSADTSSDRGEEMHGLWGSPLYQRPPRATYTVETLREETKTVQREGEAPNTTTTKRRVLADVAVPLERSELAADFA